MIIHLQGYTGPRITWADEMNFVVDHATGAGSITRPVDQQSSALPLYHGRHRKEEVHRVPFLDRGCHPLSEAVLRTDFLITDLLNSNILGKL